MLVTTGTHKVKSVQIVPPAVLELISNKASKSKLRQTFNVLEAISFSFLIIINLTL